MAEIKTNFYTYNDYLTFSDNQRCEINNGKLINMSPSPNLYHQTIVSRLFSLMDEFVYKNDLGQVFASPCDVILSNIDIYQPDLIYILKENLSILSNKKAIKGAPDLVVEVLSPSNKEYDRVEKFKVYESFKIKEYWIIDPDTSSIEIYSLEEDKYILCGIYADSTNIKSPLLEGFSFNYANLIERIRF